MKKVKEIPRISVAGIMDVKTQFTRRNLIEIKCSWCGRIKRLESTVGRPQKYCSEKCRSLRDAAYNKKYCASPKWKAIRKQRREERKEKENAE